MKTVTNLLRFLPSNPFAAKSPRLLTVKTAADYVSSYNEQGYTFEVTGTKMGRLYGEPKVRVDAIAISEESGERFSTYWEVWEEPERGHSSGLYGEW